MIQAYGFNLIPHNSQQGNPVGVRGGSVNYGGPYGVYGTAAGEETPRERRQKSEERQEREHSKHRGQWA